ncbi:MAG: hypothetical protein ACJAVI_002596 [Candidatus Azotimanducaceae bacterium]|jgi:hypothetical protein
MAKLEEEAHRGLVITIPLAIMKPGFQSLQGNRRLKAFDLAMTKKINVERGNGTTATRPNQ